MEQGLMSPRGRAACMARMNNTSDLSSPMDWEYTQIFPKFMDLPPEVRLQIWHLVEVVPRVVDLRAVDKIPPLLRTCWESRIEVLAHYDIVFPFSVGPTGGRQPMTFEGLCINWRRDIFMFPYMNPSPLPNTLHVALRSHARSYWYIWRRVEHFAVPIQSAPEFKCHLPWGKVPDTEAWNNATWPQCECSNERLPSIGFWATLHHVFISLKQLTFVLDYFDYFEHADLVEVVNEPHSQALFNRMQLDLERGRDVIRRRTGGELCKGLQIKFMRVERKA